MFLEAAVNGFRGLVYTPAVTPRVRIVQFVTLMLITFFWKDIQQSYLQMYRQHHQGLGLEC